MLFAHRISWRFLKPGWSCGRVETVTAVDGRQWSRPVGAEGGSSDWGWWGLRCLSFLEQGSGMASCIRGGGGDAVHLARRRAPLFLWRGKETGFSPGSQPESAANVWGRREGRGRGRERGLQEAGGHPRSRGHLACESSRLRSGVSQPTSPHALACSPPASRSPLAWRCGRT